MLAFLEARFPGVGGPPWLERLARGDVVDATAGASSRYPVRQGMRIWYYRELEQETPIPFEEAGAVPGRALAGGRQAALPADDPDRAFPARDPAGAAEAAARAAPPDTHPPARPRNGRGGDLLAQPATRGTYQSMFQKRAMRKVYEALAPCSRTRIPVHLPQPDGRWREVLRHAEEAGEPNAETLVELIEPAAAWRATACIRTPGASTSCACTWPRWACRS